MPLIEPRPLSPISEDALGKLLAHDKDHELNTPLPNIVKTLNTLRTVEGQRRTVLPSLRRATLPLNPNKYTKAEVAAYIQKLELATRVSPQIQPLSGESLPPWPEFPSDARSFAPVLPQSTSYFSQLPTSWSPPSTSIETLQPASPSHRPPHADLPIASSLPGGQQLHSRHSYTPGGSAAELMSGPRASYELCLDLHINLLKEFDSTPGRTRDTTKGLKIFFNALEKQGINWNDITKDGITKDKLLEILSKTTLGERKLNLVKRSLNRFCNVSLPAKNGSLMGSGAHSEPIMVGQYSLRNNLKNDHHRSTIQGLKVGLRELNRLVFFFAYLEENGILWSQFKQGDEWRDLDRLSCIVSKGVIEGRFNVYTRHALNNAFGLHLKGPTHKTLSSLKDPTHLVMMNDAPGKSHTWLTQTVRNFLAYLEEEGTSWSALAAAGSGEPTLQDIVDTAQASGAIQPNTWLALNETFNAGLTGVLREGLHNSGPIP